MFGLFRSRKQKLALKLERLLMTQESAYEKGAWSVFVYAGQQVSPLLRRINQETDWTEQELEEFLRKRGLVKSLTVSGYQDKMTEAQMEAGALYI